MNEFKTMDANEAVSIVSYKFSELVGIYPITPASPMAENIEILSSQYEKNFFGNVVKVTEMQSEAGAIALVHGALQSGCYSSTFTASQGLLLMIPTLYKLSGEMLPAVIHVAARSLSTHALSIFGDHQDIYATRQTGICILASSNPTQSYHMACIAHLSAIKGSLPFINFFDGFRTSHQIEKIKLIDYEKINKLIDKNAIKNFRLKALNDNKPNTRGTAQNEDIYFQNTEVRNIYYDEIIDIVNNYMIEFNKINKTNYAPFTFYGNNNAENIIIAMGSVCGTIKETINILNKKDYNIGLIEVHLYRPFSTKHIKKVLPKSVKNIAVLDRTKEPGAGGEPLYLDVVNALKDIKLNIFGGRYGLSSKNVPPKDIKAIYDYMKNNKLKHNFTIGINDDLTKLSLVSDSSFKPSIIDKEFLIYGYGSDGMVSTSKDILKIIGDYTDCFVQGYFQYDSKKSGGVTRSHIKINNKYIDGAYYVETPSLVVISKDTYIFKYNIVDNIKDKGTILLNTDISKENLIESLPNKVRYLLAKKRINLYIIDAYKIANDLGLKNKVNTCLEICMFKLIDIIDITKIKDIIKSNNIKRFKSKGDKIIKINNNIVDQSLDFLEKVNINYQDIFIEYFEKENDNFYELIENLEGDKLPVSSFKKYHSGIYDSSTTKFEKREIAVSVPQWIPENCIECNNCAFVCPHSVIRPFLLEENDNNFISIPSIQPKNKKYSIGVSYKDCTGCGICVDNCPGKLGKKALKMEKYDSTIYRQDNFDKLLNKNVNSSFIPEIMNSKNIGFSSPKFEFSGACAGCGETPYIKILTQFFNKNLIISNATGCSSIYGASLPSLPYNVAWTSSLFEDNSEYGLGISQSIDIKRKAIEEYMLNNNDLLFEKWLKNKNNYTLCNNIKEKIDYSKHPFLKQYIDYITPKSIWIVGGDGFAYDIGFSGLDHVLSTNENINILVLDTEVYSNTGGQQSKSSNIGSVAAFASNGKKTYKKDLAKIALCYPNVYVATTNIGYDKNQYLKVLEEASNWDGPSLVIAYAPCIEHGIITGMENGLNNSFLATECGYFLTFRYNPATTKFTLDSKNISFDKYNDFLKTQNRFLRLMKNNPTEGQLLIDMQKNWAIKRYNYFKKWEL